MTDFSSFLVTGPPRKLPYEPLSEGVRSIVVKAIVAAWSTVRKGSAVGASSQREVPINAELCTELNRMMVEKPSVVEGFSASIFETVVRGGELETQDGVSLEKRPDLTFRLAGDAPSGARKDHWAMFAECKLVKGTYALIAYSENGLKRFLRCEYAWAMPHALMVAYSSPIVTTSDLAAHLVERSSELSMIGQPAVDQPPPADLVRSRHDRKLGVAPSEAGPIEISHIWLTY